MSKLAIMTELMVLFGGGFFLARNSTSIIDPSFLYRIERKQFLPSEAKLNRLADKLSITSEERELWINAAGYASDTSASDDNHEQPRRSRSWSFM